MKTNYKKAAVWDPVRIVLSQNEVNGVHEWLYLLVPFSADVTAVNIDFKSSKKLHDLFKVKWSACEENI
jgi:hypothetical protein